MLFKRFNAGQRDSGTEVRRRRKSMSRLRRPSRQGTALSPSCPLGGKVGGMGRSTARPHAPARRRAISLALAPIRPAVHRKGTKDDAETTPALFGTVPVRKTAGRANPDFLGHRSAARWWLMFEVLREILGEFLRPVSYPRHDAGHAPAQPPPTVRLTRTCLLRHLPPNRRWKPVT